MFSGNSQNIAVLKSSNSAGTEWPMFMGNLNHTGVTDTTPVGNSGPIWSSASGMLMGSSPVISNGLAFVGCYDGLYCFNAISGVLLWNYSTPSYIMSAPAVSNGFVYFGCEDDNMYCLYTNNGTQLWNYTTGSSIYSSPSLYNGYVYVGSLDGYLYCLYANNGTLSWKDSINPYYLSPTIANGFVYAGGLTGEYCLYASNGTSVWTYPIGSIGSSTISGNFVYFGGIDNNTYCLYANNGTFVWKYHEHNLIMSTPAVDHGRLFIGDYDGILYCVNSTNGRSLWNYTTGSMITSSATISNGLLYIGSNDGYLYCLNETTGSLFWSDMIFMMTLSSPAIVNGMVYVAGEVNLYCLPMIMPPSAPLNLNLTPGNRTVDLSWNIPSENGGSSITGYNIYRGTSSSSETLLTTVGNITSYTDTGLTNGQTYYYEVSAINGAGESQKSVESSSTPTSVPTVPTSLQVTVGNTELTLNWQAPLSNGGYSIVGYNIYRGTSSSSETLLTTLGNVLSYTDTGLANGQTYYYNISAINSLGEGIISNEVYGTPAGNPSQPESFQIVAGNENINLTWTAPLDNDGSPITGYNIYRGTTSGSETLLTTVGNVTTYVDTGLTNTQIYYYQISAVNIVGEGTLTSEVSATPLGVSTQPENLNGVIWNETVTLSWNIPLNNGGFPIMGYNIYRGTSSGGETLLTTVGNVTSYTDTGLTSGQTYYYEVSANNSFGESLKSNECSPTPATVPGAPINLQIKAGNDKLTLSWQAPSNNGGSPIIGYRIYRGTTSGKEVYDTTVGNITSFTDSPLIDGQTYYYTVCAINKVGNGPQSTESGAIPTTNNSIGGMSIDGILFFSGVGLVYITYSIKKRFR